MVAISICESQKVELPGLKVSIFVCACVCMCVSLCVWMLYPHAHKQETLRGNADLYFFHMCILLVRCSQRKASWPGVQSRLVITFLMVLLKFLLIWVLCFGSTGIHQLSEHCIFKENGFSYTLTYPGLMPLWQCGVDRPHCTQSDHAMQSFKGCDYTLRHDNRITDVPEDIPAQEGCYFKEDKG